MLGTPWSNEVEWDMWGATDVLMWERAVGASVALAHHTLAHEVHPPHDKEGQDDANDRTDGTAVGLGHI